MKRLFFIFHILLSVLLISGCVDKKVIDDVNISVGMGLDKSEGQLKGTIMIPVFKEDKSIGNFTFTAEGAVTRDAIIKMQNKASQPIVGGSLDIILLGENLAREGIISVLDVFLREPTIGAGLKLAIVDGTPEEIFKANYGDRGNSEYLDNLLEHNMRDGSLPLSNLHLFLVDYYQKGKDAYLPLLKKKEPELVNIMGVALFKGEKVVDILTMDKMYYFKLLVDKRVRGSVMIKRKQGESFIKTIKSRHKIKLVNRNPYQFVIDLKVKGNLTEHEGRDLGKNEVKDIEKQLEKQIVDECTAMIKDFQKQKIDPIGFGHFVKTKTRSFDFGKWEEDYKSAQFKVNADVEIVEIGVIE